MLSQTSFTEKQYRMEQKNKKENKTDKRENKKSGSKPPMRKPEVTVARKSSLGVRGRNLERNPGSREEPILLWSSPDEERMTELTRVYDKI